jgi:hypothetical protein
VKSSTMENIGVFPDTFAEEDSAGHLGLSSPSIGQCLQAVIA